MNSQKTSSTSARKATVLPRANGPVKDPNENDVLFGRGARLYSYSGNVQMRSLAMENSEEYLNKDATNVEKLLIVDKIVNRIRLMDPPGRFLKQDSETKMWWDVGDEQARKKVSQALRESASWKKQHVSPSTSLSLVSMQDYDPASGQTPLSILFQEHDKNKQVTNSNCGSEYTLPYIQQEDPNAQSLIQPEDAAESLEGGAKLGWASQYATSATVALRSAGAAFQTIAGRLLLHECNGQFEVPIAESLDNERDESQRKVRSPMEFIAAEKPYPFLVNGSPSASGEIAKHRSVEKKQSWMRSSAQIMVDKASPDPLGNITGSWIESQNERSKQQSASNSETITEGVDVGAVDFLLSTLKEDIDGGPKFTEEQEKREKELTTEDEKMEILTDLFGDLCVTPRKKKKIAKQTHSKSEIDLLLREMRVEIERTPLSKKAALEEARKKCSPELFSNERMELFLLCVDMIPEKAAERFIRYWEKRRELFGPDKFHLPMTLSGALRDDTVALKTGVASMLPRPDASGRQIILYEPLRHTRDGYTIDSLLRTVWYMAEVIAQSPEDVKNGVVVLVNAHNRTLWDYDRKMESSWIDLEEHYLPYRYCSVHVAGIPTQTIKIIRPITMAQFGKRVRNRFVVHDVYGDALIDSLANYGISKDMIPQHMGGDAPHDHLGWLERRRNEGK